MCNVISSLWYEGARRTRGAELDPFYYRPWKLHVYENSKWLRGPFQRHQNKKRETGLTWKTRPRLCLSFSLALVALVAVYTLTSSPGVAPCIFIFAVTFPEIKTIFFALLWKNSLYYFSKNSICPCQRTPQKLEKALPLLPLLFHFLKEKKKSRFLKSALCDVVWGTVSLLGIDSNLGFFLCF